MAEWAREGCCSFRCSRPSGSWRRFPAAEPAARLAEISPCMRHWPHRRRHLQEHWLSLDLLDTSACACPPRWNHCLALAPAALPSRPVSAVDTYNRNGSRGYELLLLKPKCTRRSKMPLYTWDWHRHTNSGMQNNCVELPCSFQGHRPRHLTNA